MPVRWQVRGKLLIFSVIGLVESKEVERSFVEAVSAVGSGTLLLWDARRAEVVLTSDELARRFDLVDSLGERGLLRRAALLVEKEDIAALFAAEMPKAFARLPVATFRDEAEALAWLEDAR